MPFCRILKSIAGLLCALLISSNFSTAQTRWNGDWVASSEGGSIIDIPGFLLDGPVRGLFMDGKQYGIAYEGSDFLPFSLQQWWAQDGKGTKPGPFLQKTTRTTIVQRTYFVDRGEWAAISGYTNASATEGFYAICKLKPARLVCVRMYWEMEDHTRVVPILERIVSSFRRG